MIYEGDSFFTLGAGGRIALVLLSATMAVGLVATVGRVRARRGGVAGLAAAVLLWWLFLWLGPQVYYTLYLALFDDLPLQVVVGVPPGPGRMAELLSFTGRATLSDHSAGLLGWAMGLAGMLPGLSRSAGPRS